MALGFDEGALAFDLDVLFTQSAQVERDQAVPGKYGQEAAADYQVVATIPCRFSWWKTQSGRSTSREWAEPQSRIFYTGGVLTMEAGADIRDGDHVGAILENGEVVVEGPFQVSSVQAWEDHTDVQLTRPAAE
jgi:hypothetical protein